MNRVVTDFVCAHLNKSWATSFLGVSYRSGVGDLRESSALELVTTLSGGATSWMWSTHL